MFDTFGISLRILYRQHPFIRGICGGIIGVLSYRVFIVQSNRTQNHIPILIELAGIASTLVKQWWNIQMKQTGIELAKSHDDVIKWLHIPRYWPFVRGIHRSPVNSPHKGQWGGALIFSLICAWINGGVNNREAGDLRRYRAHCDVIVIRNNHAKAQIVYLFCYMYCTHALTRYIILCNSMPGCY